MASNLVRRRAAHIGPTWDATIDRRTFRAVQPWTDFFAARNWKMRKIGLS
jgi:hypothetical protein